MLRRYIFVQLKPEHRAGLKIVQLLKTAKEVLPAAYGVMGMHVGHAADDDTKKEWDLCFTVDFASDVDLQRCLNDAVTRAFMQSYLGSRADKVWAVSFEGDFAGPRRL